MKQIITKKWLEEKEACQEGIDKFVELKEKNTDVLIKLAIKSKETKYLEWANWLITRTMTKKECVGYAIYAAKSVLKNFEKVYPQDNRPRKAIRAAFKYLNSPTIRNKIAAEAAAEAAGAAAEAARAAGASAHWRNKAGAAIRIKILKYSLKTGAKNAN